MANEPQNGPNPEFVSRRRIPATEVYPPAGKFQPDQLKPRDGEPPAAPRQITGAIRRRTWGEPQVRIWWIATLAITFVLGWFLVDQIQEFRRDSELINHGTVVEATISDVNGVDTKGKNFPPDSPVRLRFEDKKGQPVFVNGILGVHGESGYVTVGKTVTIHYDPLDPSEWTDHESAEPMTSRTVTGLVILPVALAAAWIAFNRRRRFLRVWRQGQAEPFVVVDSRQSALAPKSHAVRCAASGGRDQQLIMVFIPGKLGNPQPGDLLWLIHPPGKPREALAAMAYM